MQVYNYIIFEININVSEPTSSIRSFNTEVTTEPHKRGGCSA